MAEHRFNWGDAVVFHARDAARRANNRMRVGGAIAGTIGGAYAETLFNVMTEGSIHPEGIAAGFLIGLASPEIRNGALSVAKTVARIASLRGRSSE